MKDIIKIASEYFSIPKSDIIGKTREFEAKIIRHMLFKLFRENNELSLSTIGKIFNRNHATVIHGINSINNLIETDNYIKKKFDYLSILVADEDVLIVLGAESVGQY
jgi:chromosomal replication initiator protein